MRRKQGEAEMYEHRRTPPLTMGQFLRRMAFHGGVALLVIAGSLLIGMFGYGHWEPMGVRDAFLNSAMLLSGMGPVKTEGLSEPGKLFAGLYALYSGIVFIAVMGILLAPVVHRVMHRFHWDEDERGEG